MADNITVRNVIAKHCGNGFSTNGMNGLIEDSLFEDICGYGGRFHSTKNVTLRLEIIAFPKARSLLKAQNTPFL